MSNYFFLLPLSLALGLVGLATFLWTLKRNQYEDLEGAKYRILDEDDFPLASSAGIDESVRNEATVSIDD